MALGMLLVWIFPRELDCGLLGPGLPFARWDTCLVCLVRGLAYRAYTVGEGAVLHQRSTETATAHRMKICSIWKFHQVVWLVYHGFDSEKSYVVAPEVSVRCLH